MSPISLFSICFFSFPIKNKSNSVPTENLLLFKTGLPDLGVSKKADASFSPCDVPLYTSIAYKFLQSQADLMYCIARWNYSL